MKLLTFYAIYDIVRLSKIGVMENADKTDDKLRILFLLSGLLFLS